MISKSKSKALVLFLAVILMIGAITATVIFATNGDSTPTPTLSIESYNLSHDEWTHILYAVSNEGFDREEHEIKMLFWNEPQSEYLLGTESYSASNSGKATVKEKDTLVFYSKGLTAKEMADDIYCRACVTVGGETYYSETVKFSVLEYVCAMKEKGGMTDNYAALLGAMLDYGAAAQKNFNYNTGRLANLTYNKVTVVNGALSDGFTTGRFYDGESIVLTAPEKSGELSFSHWEDESGANVANTTNATVAMEGKSKTYTAVYTAEDDKMYTKRQSVLLLGQSNMSGRGYLETVEKISDPRILMMRDGEFVPMVEPIHYFAQNGGVGLAASFAKAFVETFDCELGLVPCAEGGTSLADWAVGGELYNNAIECAKVAMETSDICAILWHQGESNQSNNYVDYAEKLEVIFDAMIEELGLDPDKIVIVAGELGTFRTSYRTSHRAQLDLLSDEYKNFGIASSEKLISNGDGTHFDAPSLRVFGYRYFNAFYNCVAGKDYSFIDDIEHYRIEVPTDEGVKELIISKDFDSNATGTASDTDCRFVGSGTFLIKEITDAGKYVEITSDSNDTYIDINRPIKLNSTFVMKARFKIEEGFNSEIQLFKVIDTSRSTIQSLSVGTDRKLYAKHSGDSNYSVYLGYSLDVWEWTEIEVLIDLQNNQRKISINGNEVLCDTVVGGTHSSSNRNIQTVRLIHYNTGNGTLCIDDYKCYIPETAIFPSVPTPSVPTEYIYSENFDSVTEGTYSSNMTFGSTQFKSLSENGTITSKDGVISITSDNTTPYVDLLKTINAGSVFVVEGKFKISEDFNAEVELLKLRFNDGAPALVKLSADGALYNYYFNGDTGVKGDKLCELSSEDWTTVTVICDLTNNKKDIYINGTLVCSGVTVYKSSITSEDTRVTLMRVSMFNSGSGTVDIDYVNYWYAE